MMFLLFFYVVYNNLLIPVGISQGSISCRPGVEIGEIACRFHPKVGSCFDFFDEISKADRRMDIRQDVDVVFSSVDPVKDTVSFSDYSTNVLVEIFMAFRWQRVGSVMGTEDNVIENLTIAIHIYVFWLTLTGFGLDIMFGSPSG